MGIHPVCVAGMTHDNYANGSSLPAAADKGMFVSKRKAVRDREDGDYTLKAAEHSATKGAAGEDEALLA